MSVMNPQGRLAVYGDGSQVIAVDTLGHFTVTTRGSTISVDELNVAVKGQTVYQYSGCGRVKFLYSIFLLLSYSEINILGYCEVYPFYATPDR